MNVCELNNELLKVYGDWIERTQANKRREILIG